MTALETLLPLPGEEKGSVNSLDHYATPDRGYNACGQSPLFWSSHYLMITSALFSPFKDLLNSRKFYPLTF